MIDLFVMIGIGAITIYYTIKIYSGKCRPRIPLAIEQPYYEEEEEIPPKYEDIVAENI